jgi:PBSX family phage portal protein
MSKQPAIVKSGSDSEPKVHIIQKVIAGDTYLVMADSAAQLEDEFTGLYYSTSSVSNVALQPPFEPKTLARMPNLNNVLSQCIEAMEVNIDGTGHEFMSAEEGTPLDKEQLKAAESFFNEPYPGKSFLQIRRKLRRELESVGCAYLEVLSTVSGEVAGLRNVEGTTIRMVKLDDAVQVTKTVMRNGKPVELKLMERERRYVQKLGSTTMVYFREFGASRDLNKATGEWAKEGVKLPANQRASDLLTFGVNPDVGTPYSVPRWINQLPSVIGSRKAEEQNLEFFDAGGMPPAIIFVQGGTLAKTASDQLRGYLSGQVKNRQRAVVVEAMSSSGNLEGSSGGVQVKVERFGAEQAKDAMYQNYDKNAEDHIRAGFRLPKLFLGRSDDYNYATAVVAYMVAEEQVFRPERVEFDDCITKNILKALGLDKIRFVSKPITLKNIDNQLKAIEMLKGLVKEDEYVAEIAMVGGITLAYDKKTAEDAKQAAADAANKQPAVDPNAPAPDAGAQLKPVPDKAALGKSTPSEAGEATAEPAMAKVAKSDVAALALRYAQSRGITTRKSELSEQDVADITADVEALKGDELTQFNKLVAVMAFGSEDHDELAGCCH